MNTNSSFSLGGGVKKLFSGLRFQRATAFGIIILVALLAFESFNYSTTEFALNDLLGSLKFAGLRWATILSIAFCGIDFAGIARLFSPDKGNSEPNESWYLFGAWMLAATMNAILTWWGVSMAIVNHTLQSSAVIDAETLLNIVPVFVAVMVWLIRILIIGSLSYMGGRMFNQPGRTQYQSASRPQVRTLNVPTMRDAPLPAELLQSRPAPRPAVRPETAFVRPEPTYHSMGASGHTTPKVVQERPTLSPDTRR